MAYRYIGGYFQSVLAHYQFEGDHLGQTKGYEYYGKMAEKITTYGTDKVIDFFVDLQVWGTPEQCYDKIMDIRRRVGNDHYVGVFSYAGMPPDEAERNMRLFAARGAARPLPGRRGSAGPEPYGLSRGPSMASTERLADERIQRYLGTKEVVVLATLGRRRGAARAWPCGSFTPPTRS